MADEKTAYRWDGPKAEWDNTQFLKHGDDTLSRGADAKDRVVHLTENEHKDLARTQKLVKADDIGATPEATEVGGDATTDNPGTGAATPEATTAARQRGAGRTS